MRTVRVPRPSAAWELRCEGPFSPSALTSKVAHARFDAALAALPRLDLAHGEEGWTVAWRSAVLESGPLLKVWLWCVRPQHGAELARALATHLEAAGFTARPAPRPRDADSALAPRVVYLRVGPLRLGLDARAEMLFDALEVVEDERDDIDLGLRYRFTAQSCPACGVEDVPLALVAGSPSPELLPSAELGEVALAGSEVDRRARKNARCRRCGADFVAR